MKTLGYLGFLALFVVELIFVALHPEATLSLEPWQLLALGIAAFRGGHAISFNVVFEWLRRPFCDVVRDSSGAGDSVEPKYTLEGFWATVANCIACPICTGTHVGSALLTIITLWPEFGILLTYALAVAGIAEILHFTSERDEWQSRYAREMAGSLWLEKNHAA